MNAVSRERFCSSVTHEMVGLISFNVINRLISEQNG